MPFWNTTKKKSIRKKKPVRTLKQILSDALTTEVDKDPDLKRELALRDAGYDDIVKKRNPVEVKKQEIKAKILERALQRIEDNPELTEQFVDAQIGDIVGEGKSRDHGNDRYEGGEHRSLLDEIEEIEEVKERLGGGKGALGGLIDKDVIIELIKQFGPMILARQEQVQSMAAERRVVILNEQGQLTEITESQYNELAQKGMLRPVAAIAPPPVKNPSETVVPETKTGTATSPEQTVNLDEFSSFFSYLELPPEEFVEQLNTEIEAGNGRICALRNFLALSNYEVVVKLIAPYKADPVASYYVEKLLSPEGKAWAEEVLKILKEKPVG